MSDSTRPPGAIVPGRDKTAESAEATEPRIRTSTSVPQADPAEAQPEPVSVSPENPPSETDAAAAAPDGDTASEPPAAPESKSPPQEHVEPATSTPASSGDEASLAEFAKALESFEKGKPSRSAGAVKIVVGAKVSAKVVSIGDQHALFDIGGRSEAAAETKFFRKDDGTSSLSVGDTVDLFVIKTGEEILLAPSIRSDKRAAAMTKVREAHAAGMPISGRVTAVNSGGLAVNVGGVRGFCPISQIEAGYCEDPSGYVGRRLEFLVAEVKKGRGGVVLSRKKLLRRAQEEAGRKLLAKLQVGDELEGTVVRIENFGAFVDLGGVDGLIHVSELSHTRVAHPRDVVRQGEKVRARVLKIEGGKGGQPRIALSIKATQPDPWAGIEDRFHAQARVTGKVVRLTDFGAFVNLEPGIDGLVHVSEIAPQRIAHPKDVLTVGQQIEAIVVSVDPTKNRISLSMRAASGEEALGEAQAPMGSSWSDGESAPRESRRPRGDRGRDRPERNDRRERRPRDGRRGRGGRDREVDEERGNRGRGGGGTRDREGGVGRSWSSSDSSRGEDLPTTMAMALRKAREQAKKKQREADEA